MLEGLYNVTPEAAPRLNDNYETLASNIGDWSQVANSVNLNVTARMRNGLMLQGGFNTGDERTTTTATCGRRFPSGRSSWRSHRPTRGATRRRAG